MSDDEQYDYDYGSDGGDYDYGSDGGDENNKNIVDESDDLVQIENAFYEGEDLQNDNPKKAIEMFEQVVELETNLGDDVTWRFKALKYLVIMYFTLGIYDKMIIKYRLMLKFVSAVTRNESTEAINIILDKIALAKESLVLVEMYEITLEALKILNNERILFTTYLKLAKVYLEQQKLSELDNLISILKKNCQTTDGYDDPTKGNSLLEIYCIEIQMCSIANDANRMKQVYPKTLSLNTAVVVPKIMGVIREEGGKMQMLEGNWIEAYNEFYESFRNYQVDGNSRARTILKYVVLASMLSLSDINPFAAVEARVFADDKEIIAMSDLRQSLEANDLARFERTVKNKQNKIMDEPLLMTYLEPLRRRMREQVLLNLIRPYQKVHINYLANELLISNDDVENLLIDLILDHKLKNAYIDQIKNHLIIEKSNINIITNNSNNPPDHIFKLLSKWADTLITINESFGDKLN